MRPELNGELERRSMHDARESTGPRERKKARPMSSYQRGLTAPFKPAGLSSSLVQVERSERV